MFGSKKNKKKKTSEDDVKNQRLYPRYKIGLKNIFVELDNVRYPIIDFSYGGVALLNASEIPEEATAKAHFMKYQAIVDLKKVYTSKKRTGFMILHDSKESLNQLSPIVEGLNASDKMLLVDESHKPEKFKEEIGSFLNRPMQMKFILK